MLSRLRNTLCLFCTVSLLIFLATGLCGCKSKYRFAQGKDTHEAFGDGEYQLVRLPDKSMGLNNCDKNVFVMYDVKSYQETGSNVYFFGRSPYSWTDDCGSLFAILNTETNDFQWVVDEDSSSTEQRQQLEEYFQHFLSGEPITIISFSEISQEDRDILLKILKE